MIRMQLIVRHKIGNHTVFRTPPVQEEIKFEYTLGGVSKASNEAQLFGARGAYCGSAFELS